MRYLALACDYDGTLAWDGQIAASTVAALLALRDSGRKTLLVTGRELADLMTLLPDLDLFDRIVAENGAMLYRPASKEVKDFVVERAVIKVESVKDAKVLSPELSGKFKIGYEVCHIQGYRFKDGGTSVAARCGKRREINSFCSICM